MFLPRFFTRSLANLLMQVSNTQRTAVIEGQIALFWLNNQILAARLVSWQSKALCSVVCV